MINTQLKSAYPKMEELESIVYLPSSPPDTHCSSPSRKALGVDWSIVAQSFLTKIFPLESAHHAISQEWKLSRHMFQGNENGNRCSSSVVSIDILYVRAIDRRVPSIDVYVTVIYSTVLIDRDRSRDLYLYVLQYTYYDGIYILT